MKKQSHSHIHIPLPGQYVVDPLPVYIGSFVNGEVDTISVGSVAHDSDFTPHAILVLALQGTATVTLESVILCFDTHAYDIYMFNIYLRPYYTLGNKSSLVKRLCRLGIARNRHVLLP